MRELITYHPELDMIGLIVYSKTFEGIVIETKDYVVIVGLKEGWLILGEL